VKSRKLRAGELVEVRSREEILRTLDQRGQLEGMPFMPQMFQFCGRRFRVFKRAHKTCDTVFPTRSRRMANAVHLETRCDGQAYGGCQAGCLLFWKEAWLKRVERTERSQGSSGLPPPPERSSATAAERDVWAGTRRGGQEDGAEPAYVCQATQLPYATADLSWWDVRQYLEDWTSGNAGAWRILQGVVYSAYYHLSQAGIGLGRPLRWFYDKFHPAWRGTPFPRRAGPIPAGTPTPSDTLNLQPGEWVRVKPYREILATLNTENRNRGLYFDAEAVPFCGGIYRVARRVSQILDEKTGKLVRMRTDSIVLEGVYCQARYSDCRMFCPRAIETYWREIWLERVPPGAGASQAGAGDRASGRGAPA